MVSPEFSSNYDREASHVVAEFDLTPKEHLTVQSFILTGADQLSRNFNADRRDVELERIALLGGVPILLQSKFGAGFRTMDIKIVQTPNDDTDPAMRITLKDSELAPDVVITTDSNPAPLASDKFFWAQQVGSRNTDYLRGDEISDLIDAVLKTGGTLAHATDPRRQPLSFNGLVNSIEQVAAKHTPQPIETLSYATDEFDFDVTEQSFLPYERSACLKVSKAGNVSRFSLEIFGLLNLGFDADKPVSTVAERVYYAFERAKTADARNLVVSVALSSREIGREQLGDMLTMPNRHWQPTKAMHKAVSDIYTSKTQLPA